MKHIAVLNPKGGCGKTTIATHLAVYASTLGLDVALADHDAQHSSHDWMKSRPHRCADIDLIAAYRGDALGRNYDFIIHDMPAGDFATSQLPLDVCTKVIIPLMPSPIDLKAALQLWMRLSEQGWLDNSSVDFGIVANRVKSNTKFLKIFDEFIEKLEIPRVTTLRDTQNYIRSMDSGLTLFDLPPGRVVQDLIQWEPLMEWSGFMDFDDDDLQDLLGEIAEQGDPYAIASSQSSDSADGLLNAIKQESGSIEEQLDRALETALLSLADAGSTEVPKPTNSKNTGAAALGSRDNFSKDTEFETHVSGEGSNETSAHQWLSEAENEDQEFISLDDYHAEQLEEETLYTEQEEYD